MIFRAAVAFAYQKPTTTHAGVPIWKKYTLAIEEASKYFRIGENKLRKLAEENPTAGWVIMNGSRIQIKRKQFEKIIDALEVFGACSIENVKLSDAKEWALRMEEKGYSFKTINNHKPSLKAAFYTAIQDHINMSVYHTYHRPQFRWHDNLHKGFAFLQLHRLLFCQLRMQINFIATVWEKLSCKRLW